MALTADSRNWFPRLLVAVVCLYIGGFLVLNAPEANEGDAVPVDGQPHTVAVSAYRSTVMFVPESADPPSCQVADPDTGGVYPLAPPSRSDSFSSTTPEGFAPFQAFTPSTETVVVTCTGAGDAIRVATESAGLPYKIARYGGATVLLLLGLGLLGTVLAMALRRRPGPARPQTD